MASRVIEEKIVKFGIDDADFKKGLVSAASGLKGMSNALDNMSKEDRLKAMGTSMNALGEAIGNTGSKFSIMGTAAAVALGNIATKAIQTGAHLVKSLTLDPVMQGFNMYEARINSVNMLTAALESKYSNNAKQLTSDIKGALTELQNYAQTTRYEVGQMHNSLAQFVNAGVGLKDATSALKGWGNLAASAGASNQMFAQSLQFGVQQALQMGKMMTQNWMSVENAGMATQRFKDALLANAQAMGKNVDMSNGFRESLSQGWLTNDVLIKTLNDLANDKTLVKMAADFHTFGEAADATREGVVAGWSNFWETLMGEAGSKDVTKFWSTYGNAAANAVTSVSQAATGLAAKFVELGGRSEILRSLSNAMHSLKAIAVAIGKAFDAVFPKATVNTARSFVDAFKNLANHLTISSSALNGITAIFKVFFSVVRAGLSVINTVAKAIELLIPDNLIENMLSLSGAVINLFGGIVNAVKSFIPAVDMSPVGKSFKWLSDIIHGFNYTITNWINNFADAMIKWNAHAPKLTKEFIKQHPIIQSVGDALSWVAEQFGKLFKMIGNLPILQTLGGIFSSVADGAKRFAEAINLSGAASTAWNWIKDLWSWLAEKLGPAFDYVVDKARGFSSHIGDIGSTLKGMVPSAESFNNVLEAVVDTLSHPFGSTAYADELSETDDKTVTVTKHTTTWRDVLKTLGNIIKSVAGFIAGIFKPALDAATTIISKFWQYLKQSDILSEFLHYITGAKEGVGRLGLAFDALGTLLGGKLYPIIRNLIQWFLGSTVSADELEKSVKKVGGTTEEASGKFEGFKGFLDDFKEAAKDMFGEIDESANKFIKGAAVVGLALLLFKAKKMLTNLKDMFNNGAGILTWGSNVNRVLNSTAGAIDSFAGTQRAARLHYMGLALLEISTAMMILAMIPADKVKQVLLLLAAGVTALGVSILILSKAKASMTAKQAAANAAGTASSGLLSGILADLGFPEMKKVLKSIATATTMLTLVAAVGVIVKLVEDVSNKNLKKMYEGLKMVGIIMGGLVLIMQGLRGAPGSMGTALSMIAMVGAVVLIIKNIEYVADVDQKKLKRGGTIMAIVASVLTAMMFVINIGGGHGLSNAVLLMGIVISVKGLLKTLIDLVDTIKKNNVTTGQLIGAGAIISALGVVLTACVTAMNFAGNFGKPSLTNAVVLAALVIGVKGLVVSIKDLVKLTQDTSKSAVQNAANILMEMMAVLALSTAIISIDTGKVDKGKLLTMVALIAGVILIGEEIQRLGKMNKAQIQQGGIAAAAIFIGLAGTMEVIATMKTPEKSKLVLLAELVASIFVIAASLVVLGDIPWQKITIAVAALGTVLAELALYLNLGVGNASYQQAATVLATAVLAGAIAGSLALLANYNWTKIIAGAAGMGIVLLSIGASLRIANSNIMSAPTALAMAGIILELGVALTALAKLPVVGVLAAAGALSVVAVAIGAAASLIGGSGVGVLGALALAAAILAIGAALQAVANIFNGIANLINSVTEAFKTFSEASSESVKHFVENSGQIGKGVTSILGGAIEGLIKQINDIIGAFLDGIIQNAPKMGEALKQMILAACDVIIETAEPIANAIAAIITAALDMLADNIETWVQKLGDIFLNLLTGLNEWLDENKEDLANQIAALIKNIIDLAIDTAKAMFGMGGDGSDGGGAGASTGGGGKWFGFGAGMVGGLAAGITSGTGAVGLAAGTAWGAGSDKWLAGVGQAAGLGSGIIGMFSGKLGNKGLVSGATGGAWAAGKAVWTSAVGIVGGIGTNITSKFSSGISGAKGLADGAAKAVKSAVKKPLEFAQELWDSGKKIIDQFAAGIRAGINSVGGAISDVIKEAKKHLPHSPAKKGPLAGAEWYRVATSGQTLVEQWASGIASGIGSVSSVISDVVATVGDALQNADFSNQFNPVITPVVDLSGIDQADLQGIFGIQNGLNVAYSSLNANTIQMEADAKAQQDIITGMNILNAKLEEIRQVGVEGNDIAAEGKVVNSYLDKDLITKQLAPGIQDAATEFNNRLGRLGGLI